MISPLKEHHDRCYTHHRWVVIVHTVVYNHKGVKNKTIIKLRTAYTTEGAFIIHYT